MDFLSSSKGLTTWRGKIKLTQMLVSKVMAETMLTDRSACRIKSPASACSFRTLSQLRDSSSDAIFRTSSLESFRSDVTFRNLGLSCWAVRMICEANQFVFAVLQQVDRAWSDWPS